LIHGAELVHFKNFASQANPVTEKEHRSPRVKFNEQGNPGKH
jgi:hypothetical protein